MCTTVLFPPQAQQGAVAIGNFDGVHIGHQRILASLRALADQVAGPSVVFTFDPPPSALLQPQPALRLLTTVAQRDALLRAHGVDAIVVYPTNREMLMWSDREFFDRIVCTALRARAVVEGSNFRFGRDRQGDIQTLQRFCAEARMRCEIVPPVTLSTTPASGEVASEYPDAGVQTISSSRIRQLLSDGEVERATIMLGRPHRLQGTVVHGHQRGAELGFPTANLSDYLVMTPAPGVYAGHAQYKNQWYPAAIHVGPAPTFQSLANQLEVHLLDFQENLYGQQLDVTFEHRIRGTLRFDSADKLSEQLSRDTQRVRQLTQGPPHKTVPT